MQASELASSPRWGRNAGRKENLGSRLTDLDFLAEGSAMLEMVLEGQSVPVVSNGPRGCEQKNLELVP